MFLCVEIKSLKKNSFAGRLQKFRYWNHSLGMILMLFIFTVILTIDFDHLTTGLRPTCDRLTTDLRPSYDKSIVEQAIVQDDCKKIKLSHEGLDFFFKLDFLNEWQM